MQTRYQIENTQTGQIYAVTDADLDRRGVSIEEWIAARPESYGASPTVTTSQVPTAAEIEAERIDRQARADALVAHYDDIIADIRGRRPDLADAIEATRTSRREELRR